MNTSESMSLSISWRIVKIGNCHPRLKISGSSGVKWGRTDGFPPFSFNFKPINMDYLIICESNGVSYLLMAKDESNNFAIQAYKSKEDVMGAFSGYTNAWTRDSTWGASAAIGMLQMRPVAIKAIEIEEIKTFLIGELKVQHISGGAIGRGYYGLIVNPDILKYKEFDIWNESMVLAGIMERT